MQKGVLEASDGFVSEEGEGRVLVMVSMSSSIYGRREGVL